jgi:acyl-CoA thioester hydrolase
MPEGFKHKTPIQVRFSDIDMMGHVNNACYFSYVETARLKYYDDVVGADTDWHSQQGLIMARFEIDYKHALGYGDEVLVHTRCSRLGTTSFDLSWMITRLNKGQKDVAAEGKTVIVCYDYRNKKTKEIPPGRRALLARYDALAESGP